jgi:4-diphosphocytidyl-2-C-methyl-D-erythritol kinase
MMPFVWPAPAKLNWFLHVVGQREDGYHLLQTAFQFLDYTDELSFSVRADNKIELTCNLPSLISDNLILRAAQLLQGLTSKASGVDIYLNKKIPIGAGLGGGSSNAATTLVALNRLWDLQLSTAELLKLAIKLGADVPVFVHGHATWAEGIGEQFTDIDLPEPWFLVLVPPCSVATAKIFSATELTRRSAPITIQEFLDGSISTRNDCEPVVRLLYPEVGQALDWLSQFSPARLTGSGGCVFAAFDTKMQAEIIAHKVTAPFKSIIAKGRNYSPLLTVVC